MNEPSTAIRSRRALIGLLGCACALRCGVVWARWDSLLDDRDAYVAIARGLAEGRGLCTPGGTQPTAYRPPLYPLLLSWLPQRRLDVGIAFLHVLLGTATVWLTCTLARRLELPGWCAVVAGLLVAVDPLLLLYTTLPMTETVCTFLVAALLTVGMGMGRERWRWFCAAGTGVLFGLAALCRPTVWAYGGALGVWWAWTWWRGGMRIQETGVERACGRRAAAQVATAVMCAALTVLPWAVRNWRVLGRPVFTTTHGGYTLLLGNNPAYWREVVDQPFGTVWDGSRGAGQAAWIGGVMREMNAAGVHGEVEQDAWMSRRARRHIQEDPAHFLKACVRRFASFWSVTPRGGAAAWAPAGARGFIGVYFTVMYVAALVGVWRVLRADGRRWMPLLLLVASFTVVHLVFWADARMRAPVWPAVAVLAAASVGVARRGGASTDTRSRSLRSRLNGGVVG